MCTLKLYLFLFFFHIHLNLEKISSNGMQKDVAYTTRSLYMLWIDDIVYFISGLREPIQKDQSHGPIVLSKNIRPVPMVFFIILYSMTCLYTSEIITSASIVFIILYGIIHNPLCISFLISCIWYEYYLQCWLWMWYINQYMINLYVIYQDWFFF